MRTIIITAITLASIHADRPAGVGPAAVLGWWHGTSICTKAAWNAACNDEVILYEFVSVPSDSAKALLHAFKIVAGKPESMGDLDVRYSPDSATWNGDFKNSRVDIRWSYHITNDTLVGQLLLRPAMQVARRVIALRGKGNSP